MQNEFNIGDTVNLKLKNFPLNVTGEITDLYYIEEKLYLKIYSFFMRKETVYILTKNRELVRPKKFEDKKIAHASLYDLDKFEIENAGSESPSRYKKHHYILVKTISILIIISFLIPFNFNVLSVFFPPSMKYEDFLSKKYSVYELYQVITNRISYKYDFGEFWNTPEKAWKLRYGDCEEFSSVCSDYLTKHKIENYIVGLNIKNSSTGHAAVFMKLDKYFYIIDLTMALEYQGVKRLENCKSLKEAIQKYSTLPVPIFKVPAFEGDKEIVTVIY